MNTADALLRLNRQLLLKRRQEKLSAAHCRAHQAILWHLVREGQVPSRLTLAELVGEDAVEVLLQNESIASQWQAGDAQSISVVTLTTAVDLGSAFFAPLLDGRTLF